MSEDVDLVIPWDRPIRHGGIIAGELNRVRDALKAVAPIVGVELDRPDGERDKKRGAAIWELTYASSFGPQVIDLEVTMRPVLRAPRRASRAQLLDEPLAGDHSEAYSWALDADEARAEKVRAAFTREAIRDYYDLDQLLKAGKDFESAAFREIVDSKLAELRAPPLSHQPASFGLTAARRRALEVQRRKGLLAIVRVADEPFDLDAMLAQFNALWGKGR